MAETNPIPPPQELKPVPSVYRNILGNLMAVHANQRMVGVMTSLQREVPQARINHDEGVYSLVAAPLGATDGREMNLLTVTEQDQDLTFVEWITNGKAHNFDAIHQNPFILDRARLQGVSELVRQLEMQPNEYNWVAWDQMIVYGNVLLAHQTADQAQEVAEDMRAIAEGGDYLAALRETAKMYTPQRPDVFIDRQNQNPRVQGVNEAVANSIDALNGEKIGQFGLGVKQLFAYLQPGQGEVKVITKDQSGNILVLQARRGYDGQIYTRFSPVSDHDSQQVGTVEHGTSITISGIDLHQRDVNALEATIGDRFQFVQGVLVQANGEQINTDGKSISAFGQREFHQQNGKRVSVEAIADSRDSQSFIRITDNGSGMDAEALFRMFLPRQGGKVFQPIGAEEARRIAQEKAEVLLLPEDHQRLLFSRNGEVVFTIDIPQDRLQAANDSGKPLSVCLELGRIIKVSEGREGFSVDDNFINALPIVIQRVLESEHVGTSEKIVVLNSLVQGLDTLLGSNNNQLSQLAKNIRKAKIAIRRAANPYLKQLKTQGAILLPNYKQYEGLQIAGRREVQFVDPYLLEFVATDIPTLLQHTEGIQKIWRSEGITTEEGWKIFAADLTRELPDDLFAQLRDAQKLGLLRETLAQILPTIIDEKYKLVIVDKRIWQKLQAEADPAKKMLLQESLQLLLNPSVYTGYTVNRDVIHVSDGKGGPIGSDEFDLTIEETFKDRRSSTFSTVWQQGDRIFVLEHYNSKLIITNARDGSLIEIQNIVGDDNRYRGSEAIKTTPEGTWILFDAGDNGDRLPLVLVDMNGVVQRRVYLPPQRLLDFQHNYGSTEPISLTQEGNVIGVTKEGKVIICNPFTGEVRETGIGEDQHISNITQLVDGTVIGGSMYYVGQDTKELFLYSSIPGSENFKPLQIEIKNGEAIPDFSQFRFINHLGQLYIISDTNLGLEMASTFQVFRVNLQDDKATLEKVLNFRSQTFDAYGSIAAFSDPQSGALTISAMGSVYIATPKSDGTFELHDVYKTSTELTDWTNTKYYVTKLSYLFNDVETFTSGQVLSTLAIADTQRGHLHLERADDYDHRAIISTAPAINAERARQYIDRLDDPEFREEFSIVWDALRETTDPQSLGILKERFAKNYLFLITSDIQLSPKQLKLLFYSDNPLVFLTLEPDLQESLDKQLDSLDSFFEREPFLEAAGIMLRNREPAEQRLFFSQLDILFDNEKFRNEFLLNLVVHRDKIAKTSFTTLDNANPLSPYFIFLTTREEVESREMEAGQAYNDLIGPIPPQGLPIELLIYLRQTESLLTFEQMRQRIAHAGGVEGLRAEIRTDQLTNRVTAAIHGQSVGAGVDKRELVQNAVNAIKKSGVERGEIVVNAYMRGDNTEFVEEFSDNGTGIQDALAFLIPGVTTNAATGEYGFFGSGLYKIFEDVDKVEVETIVIRGGKKFQQRINLETVKEDGVSVSIKLMSLSEREITDEGSLRTVGSQIVRDEPLQSGTKIKLIKNVDDTIPQLESMITQGTIVTMGGLVTSPGISGANIGIYFVNRDGEREPVNLAIRHQAEYSIEGLGAIQFVTSTNPPTMTSGGLYMSPLYTQQPGYLDLVPSSLREIFRRDNVSVVLPGNAPLVLDRSRLSNEGRYVPEVQRIIATEAIRYSATKMLDSSVDPLWNTIVPDDFSVDRGYERMYETAQGQHALQIAEKINKKEVLSEADLQFIQNGDGNHALFLVMARITSKSGGTMFDRFMERKDVRTNFESPFVTWTTQSITESREYIPDLLASLTKGVIPEGVTTFGQVSIESLPDRDVLLGFFQKLGVREVYVVKNPQFTVAGMFIGKDRILLNANLLGGDVRKRAHVVLHELAHLLEERKHGSDDSYIDESRFTHESGRGTPFADFNLLAAQALYAGIN